MILKDIINLKTDTKDIIFITASFRGRRMTFFPVLAETAIGVNSSSSVLELLDNSSGILNLINILVTISLGIIVLNRMYKKWEIDRDTAVLNKKIATENKRITNINKRIVGLQYDIEKKSAPIREKEIELKKNELELKNQEIEVNRELLKQAKNDSDKVSDKIANKLINNPTWLDRFMDEIGATYGGSVFGSRINHFHYEKKAIMKEAINILEKELTKSNGEKKYCCLLIDSGTTTYQFFCEICEQIKKNGESKTIWEEQVFIITNNLPGIQYLMKNCNDSKSDHADICLNCLLLPGKPLSVYAAVTGDETCNFFSMNINVENGEESELIEKEKDALKQMLQRKLNFKKGECLIVSLMSGNYIVRHRNNCNRGNSYFNESYCPVARGEGHFDIKTKFADLSDKIYIISPLTKFSFATVYQLNKVNNFKIDETDPKAKYNSSQVKYREIDLSDENSRKKCVFITSKREKGDLFYNFYSSLITTLQNNYPQKDQVIGVDFKLREWLPEDENGNFSYEYRREIELKREIPHDSLRRVFEDIKREDDEMNKEEGTKKDKNFIWDFGWTSNPQIPELEEEDFNS